MAKLWAVIEANNPRLAKFSISQLGIEVFLPEYRLRVRNGRKVEVVTKPLLFGYMFARFDLATDPWERVAYCRGVESMMCAGGRPRRVLDEEVERVMAKAAEMCAEIVDQAPLTYGQAVKIIDGAFKGYPAIVTRADPDKASVGLKVNVFGRPTSAVLPREHVEAA